MKQGLDSRPTTKRYWCGSAHNDRATPSLHKLNASKTKCAYCGGYALSEIGWWSVYVMGWTDPIRTTIRERKLVPVHRNSSKTRAERYAEKLQQGDETNAYVVVFERKEK